MSRVQELQRLAKLHAAGVLTDEEYTQQKERVLGTHSAQPQSERVDVARPLLASAPIDDINKAASTSKETPTQVDPKIGGSDSVDETTMRGSAQDNSNGAMPEASTPPKSEANEAMVSASESFWQNTIEGRALPYSPHRNQAYADSDALFGDFLIQDKTFHTALQLFANMTPARGERLVAWAGTAVLTNYRLLISSGVPVVIPLAHLKQYDLTHQFQLKWLENGTPVEQSFTGMLILPDCVRATRQECEWQRLRDDEQAQLTKFREPSSTAFRPDLENLKDYYEETIPPEERPSPRPAAWKIGCAPILFFIALPCTFGAIKVSFTEGGNYVAILVALALSVWAARILIRVGKQRILMWTSIIAIGFIGMMELGRDSSKSSSSSKGYSSGQQQTSRKLVTPSQAFRIVRGCCRGAGGVYSSSVQDCISPNIDAFVGCIGDTVWVKYPNGNEYPLDGNQLIR